MPHPRRDRWNVLRRSAAGLGGGDALRNDLVITSSNEAYHDASKGGKNMHRYIERAREEAGFTLIELLIVIVILGILAGVVVFSVGGITDRGNVAACKTDLSTVTVAVEAYRAKSSNGAYPPNLDPSLTTGANQFLRPQANLAGNTLTGQGYTITYTPGTGAVDSGGFC
jgi:prepilin-type N-terminal cleavage/methylation domain-containing protein